MSMYVADRSVIDNSSKNQYSTQQNRRQRPVEMWWHTRRNLISSFGEMERVHLNRRGASVQSTAGSRGVRISGSNAGYTMFRGGVKGTGYPLHLNQ